MLFLQRISKLIVYLLGSIIVSAVFVLGLFGISNSMANKTRINMFIASTQSAVQNVTNEVEKISNDIANTIDGIKTTLQTEIPKQTEQIDQQIAKVKEIAQQEQQQSGMVSFPAMQIEKDLEAIKTGLQNMMQFVDNNLKPDQLVSTLRTVSSVISIYSEEVQRFLNQLTPELVNKTYDMVTWISFGLGASLLGCTLLGTLLLLITTKKVAGKRVSRFATTKDLEKHIAAIFQKDPTL